MTLNSIKYGGREIYFLKRELSFKLENLFFIGILIFAPEIILFERKKTKVKNSMKKIQ